MVNRHDTRARRRDLNQGNPILAPRRFPDRLADHCARPRASASSPELQASLEFSAHHGASVSLLAFHQRRNAGNVHGTSVNCRSGTP